MLKRATVRLAALALLAALPVLPLRAEESDPPPPSAPSEEAQPLKKEWTVLRVSDGDAVDYEVVRISDKKARIQELKADHEVALEGYKADKAAYEKTNKGKKYPDPPPGDLGIKTEKDFVSQEEAEAYAEAKQGKSDGKFAVLQVKDMKGNVFLKLHPEKKVSEYKKEWSDKFLKAEEEWEKKKQGWYENPASAILDSFGNPKGFKPFTELPPEKPEVKKLKGGIKTQEEGAKALAQLEEDTGVPASDAPSGGGR